MRLVDIMSALDLAVYPQVALVLFLAIFAVVLTRTFAKSRRDELERLASLPLETTETESHT